PSRQAVAALRHLLFDVGLLQWVGLLRRPETGDRRDRLAPNGADRRAARAGGPPIDVYRARAALGQAAAELGIGEPEVVAQRVEQRHGGGGVGLGWASVHG